MYKGWIPFNLHSNELQVYYMGSNIGPQAGRDYDPINPPSELIMDGKPYRWSNIEPYRWRPNKQFVDTFVIGGISHTANTTYVELRSMTDDTIAYMAADDFIEAAAEGKVRDGRIIGNFVYERKGTAFKLIPVFV